MIPYFQYNVIHLGPVPLQVWGLMVSFGILAAAFVASRMAKKRGLDPNVIWDLTFWVIMAAMIGARLMHIAYEPAYYLAHPWAILAFWQGGLSIMGGFIGAVIAGVIYLRQKHLDVWAYCDTAVFALPLGLGIGRIGCFLIHDHPGTLTSFVLGVKYPDGVRHDHGLYLSIEGVLLFFFFLFLARKQVKQGTYLVAFLLIDSTIRFILDFYRATSGAIVDVRYGGLTPAQYVSVAMFLAGIWMSKHQANKKSQPSSEGRD